jgi:hypothetical protein
MANPTGQLILYDREIHLDTEGEVAVGDTFEVVRGNGPREGDHIGSATVTGFDEIGAPTLSVRFAGENGGENDG